MRVVKGKAADTGHGADYQIDGLSGATLTTQGVNNLMEFWFGEHGFKPFLDQLQNKEGPMAETNRELLTRSIFKRNPIALLVLGICSALAVTAQMTTALVMSICVTLVIAFSSLTISIVRYQIPNSVRIGIQITVIATLVILIDQILKAFYFDLSKQLSIYVGLIITNCIVMGRAEGFAMSNPPLSAVFSTESATASATAFVLMSVAFVRELFGSGTLFG